MLSASLPPRPFVVCIFPCAIARLAFVFSSFQCKTHAIHKTVIHPPFMTWIVKILHSIQLLLHPMFQRVFFLCVFVLSALPLPQSTQWWYIFAWRAVGAFIFYYAGACMCFFPHSLSVLFGALHVFFYPSFDSLFNGNHHESCYQITLFNCVCFRLVYSSLFCIRWRRKSMRSEC